MTVETISINLKQDRREVSLELIATFKYELNRNAVGAFCNPPIVILKIARCVCKITKRQLLTAVFLFKRAY